MIGVVLAALGAFLAGYATEPILGWITFSAALVAMLLHHLWRMRALARWLERGDTPEPPRAYGAWDELHALLHRSRRDATRREAELAHTVARWRAAARALPDGVVILEEEDRIAWCNDMARLHLELDPVKDAGRPITHLVRIPEFMDYLARGDFGKPLIVRAAGEAGRVLSLQVIAYGEGQRLVLSRDITQFEQVARMRREFVANVSHELRTPLTVVAGFVETLREEGDRDAARRYLDLMADQAGRMQRLVDDLLTLSALESAPPPTLEDEVAVPALVARIAADARALSGGRHRIEIEDASGPDLLGSEKELASAFGNLVSNAIRYTPEGGTVRMRWRSEGDDAVFEVEDSGIGIAAEHLPHLTERFYRVDRGRSRETGGTGLGLAIVKHALARHGATLDIRSTPGKGSVFTARFGHPRLRVRELAHG